MIPFKNYINEAKQVGIVYHFTTILNGKSILEDNSLKSIDLLSYNSVLSGASISVTRDKNFHRRVHGTGVPSDIRIALDGNKLSHKYKIVPFHDFKYFGFKSAQDRIDEMEERILSTSIENLSDYIVEIMFKPNIDHIHIHQDAKVIKEWCDERNIPLVDRIGDKLMLEAIKLSTYRNAMHMPIKKGSNRKVIDGANEDIYGRTWWKSISEDYKHRYKEWFDGKWRKFLPINKDLSSDLYVEIDDKLSEFDYKIVDWKAGLAQATNSSRQMRIGKLLQSKGESDLLQKFNERFRGKVADDNTDKYEVVISRHPYDILGQSYDKEWHSCKNLEDGSNRHYLPTEINEGCLVAYVINKKINEVGKISDSMKENLFFEILGLQDAKTKITLNWKSYFKDEFLSIFPLIDIKKEYPKLYEEYGLQKNPTSKDPLKDPIARYLIIPYYNEDNPDDTFLYVSESVYGRHIEGFRETVQQWLDSKQGKKEGIYCLNTKQIYQDNNDSKISKIDYNKIGPELITKDPNEFYKIFVNMQPDSPEGKKLTKVLNQYLLGVKDLNKLPSPIGTLVSYPQVKILPIVTEHFFKLYEAELKRPVDMENHIYMVLDELKFSDRVTKNVLFYPMWDVLMSYFRRIFETSDQFLELMGLFKEAITKQQMARKEIIFFEEDSKPPLMLVTDVIEKNNNALEGKDENSVVTIENIMTLANFYEYRNEYYTFEEADNFCFNFNAGGFTDWRLPSVKECQMLYQHKNKLRNLNLDMFCWCDDPELKNGDFNRVRFVFSFKNGEVDARSVKFNANWCIPVRSI